MSVSALVEGQSVRQTTSASGQRRCIDASVRQSVRQERPPAGSPVTSPVTAKSGLDGRPSVGQLSEALALLRGKTITPEVVDALLYAAATAPDFSIDPLSMLATTCGDFTLQAEPFAELIAELHPLHEAQWRETEAHRHGLPFNPDYEAGKAMERAGSLVQFTIRRDSELVGHMRMYVQRSVHTQTLFAHEDTIFIKPEHRAGMLGLALVRYVEGQLRRLGVREIRFDTKHSNRADAILRRLRYEPVATRWVKVLKE